MNHSITKNMYEMKGVAVGIISLFVLTNDVSSVDNSGDSSNVDIFSLSTGYQYYDRLSSEAGINAILLTKTKETKMRDGTDLLPTAKNGRTNGDGSMSETKQSETVVDQNRIPIFYSSLVVNPLAQVSDSRRTVPVFDGDADNDGIDTNDGCDNILASASEAFPSSCRRLDGTISSSGQEEVMQASFISRFEGLLTTIQDIILTPPTAETSSRFSLEKIVKLGDAILANEAGCLLAKRPNKTELTFVVAWRYLAKAIQHKSCIRLSFFNGCESIVKYVLQPDARLAAENISAFASLAERREETLKLIGEVRATLQGRFKNCAGRNNILMTLHLISTLSHERREAMDKWEKMMKHDFQYLDNLYIKRVPKRIKRKPGWWTLFFPSSTKTATPSPQDQYLQAIQHTIFEIFAAPSVESSDGTLFPSPVFLATTSNDNGVSPVLKILIKKWKGPPIPFTHQINKGESLDHHSKVLLWCMSIFTITWHSSSLLFKSLVTNKKGLDHGIENMTDIFSCTVVFLSFHCETYIEAIASCNFEPKRMYKYRQAILFHIVVKSTLLYLSKEPACLGRSLGMIQGFCSVAFPLLPSSTKALVRDVASVLLVCTSTPDDIIESARVDRLLISTGTNSLEEISSGSNDDSSDEEGGNHRKETRREFSSFKARKNTIAKLKGVSFGSAPLYSSKGGNPNDGGDVMCIEDVINIVQKLKEEAQKMSEEPFGDCATNNQSLSNPQFWKNLLKEVPTMDPAVGSEMRDLQLFLYRKDVMQRNVRILQRQGMESLIAISKEGRDLFFLCSKGAQWTEYLRKLSNPKPKQKKRNNKLDTSEVKTSRKGDVEQTSLAGSEVASSEEENSEQGSSALLRESGKVTNSVTEQSSLSSSTRGSASGNTKEDAENFPRNSPGEDEESNPSDQESQYIIDSTVWERLGYRKDVQYGCSKCNMRLALSSLLFRLYEEKLNEEDREFVVSALKEKIPSLPDMTQEAFPMKQDNLQLQPILREHSSSATPPATDINELAARLYAIPKVRNEVAYQDIVSMVGEIDTQIATMVFPSIVGPFGGIMMGRYDLLCIEDQYPGNGEHMPPFVSCPLTHTTCRAIFESNITEKKAFSACLDAGAFCLTCDGMASRLTMARARPVFSLSTSGLGGEVTLARGPLFAHLEEKDKSCIIHSLLFKHISRWYKTHGRNFYNFSLGHIPWLTKAYTSLCDTKDATAEYASGVLKQEGVLLDSERVLFSKAIQEKTSIETALQKKSLHPNCVNVSTFTIPASGETTAKDLDGKDIFFSANYQGDLLTGRVHQIYPQHVEVNGDSNMNNLRAMLLYFMQLAKNPIVTEKGNAWLLLGKVVSVSISRSTITVDNRLWNCYFEIKCKEAPPLLYLTTLSPVRSQSVEKKTDRKSDEKKSEDSRAAKRRRRDVSSSGGSSMAGSSIDLDVNLPQNQQFLKQIGFSEKQGSSMGDVYLLLNCRVLECGEDRDGRRSVSNKLGLKFYTYIKRRAEDKDTLSPSNLYLDSSFVPMITLDDKNFCVLCFDFFTHIFDNATETIFDTTDWKNYDSQAIKSKGQFLGLVCKKMEGGFRRAAGTAMKNAKNAILDENADVSTVNPSITKWLILSLLSTLAGSLRIMTYPASVGTSVEESSPRGTNRILECGPKQTYLRLHDLVDLAKRKPKRDQELLDRLLALLESVADSTSKIMQSAGTDYKIRCFQTYFCAMHDEQFAWALQKLLQADSDGS